jgi:hypothetical protein
VYKRQALKSPAQPAFQPSNNYLLFSDFAM